MRNSFGKVLMGAAGGSGGAAFSISPAVGGKTSWVMADDGDLNLGTHGQWVITPVREFECIIEMWGAGGPCGHSYAFTSSGGNVGPGGAGGYTHGIVTFLAGTAYTIQVGEKGNRNYQSGPTNTTYIAGGLRMLWGTEGGGYTGLFKTSSVTQSTAMLMAGGGGGGGDSVYDGSGAGAGGGATAQSSGGGLQGATGGTQSAGGVRSVYNDCQSGSALTGGAGFSTGAYWGSYSAMGGGGGGYYGGGAGNVGAGGGGSGYIDTSDSDIRNELTTTGNYATPPNGSYGNRNGAGQGGTSGLGTDGRFYMSEN